MNTTITQSSPKLEFLKQLTPGFWTSVLSKTLAVAILAVGGLASAQSVPSLMNYQGKLVDGAGSPMPNGSYDVVFKVWNKASPADLADALVWGQTNSVTLVNGIFNLALGGPGGVITSASKTNLVDAFEEANRYLSLTIVRNPSGTVASPAEILPRQQMLSAPYTLKSAVATDAVNAFNGVPPGCILPFGGTNVPNGFLLCDGTAIQRSIHPRLFSAIGTAWGAGDNFNTFNLPDLRGVFLRGVNGRSADQFADPDSDSRINRAQGGNSGSAVGTFQLGTVQSHTHTGHMKVGAEPIYGGARANMAAAGTGQVSAAWDTEALVAPYGGSETRPANAYVNYIIKY